MAISEEPQKLTPTQKAQTAFEKMRAELRGEAESNLQVNEDGGMILDEGVEIIPNRVEKDLEESGGATLEQTEESSLRESE